MTGQASDRVGGGLGRCYAKGKTVLVKLGYREENWMIHQLRHESDSILQATKGGFKRPRKAKMSLGKRIAIPEVNTT